MRKAIGTDIDHVHFLIQSVSKYSITKIVGMLKSIAAREISKEIFKKHPEIKKRLRGGNIWTSGFYTNTVRQYGNKDIISRYVKNQGKNLTYHKIYESQPTLF